MPLPYDITKAIDYNRKRPGAISAHRVAQLVAHWQGTHPPLLVDGCMGPLTVDSIDLSLSGPAVPAPVVVAPSAPVVVPKPPSVVTIVLIGAVPNLTVDEVEARWERAGQLPIAYVLGAGGKDCKSDSDPRSTITRDGKQLFGADCTGASNWAEGVPKFQKNFSQYGGWQNTDAIIADARGKQEIWELLDRPVRGCGLVFAGIDFDHDGDRERIGHKAWVSAVDPAFDPKHPDYRLVTIWDCAGSNAKLPGSHGAIAKHPAGYFNGKDTYKGVTDPRWATVCVWNKHIPKP